MPWKSSKTVGLLASFLMLSAPGLMAQVIQVASTSRTVISTDLTALAGAIKFTVTSGTTGSGIIDIAFDGNPIVNTAATGITVEGTGGLTATVVLGVDQGSGTLSLSVPALGTSGNSMTLSGVRLNIVGSGVSSVAATISASGGSNLLFVAGSTVVPVIGNVKEGLQVSEDSTTVFAYEGDVVSPPNLFFEVGEGFDSAFTDDVGVLGQTAATRVRIEVKGLPEGSKLTFPALVAEPVTGATLTAVSDLIVPTSTESTAITYVFGSTASSATNTETFRIQYTLQVDTPPAEQAVVSLQATLFPAEEEIPRLETRLVPSEAELPLPEFDAFIPVLVSRGQLQGVAVTNPSDLEVTIHMEALGPAGESPAGTDIVNPATLTVPAQAQRAVLLEEVFGSGISTAEVATILVRSRRSRTVSLFFLGDQENTFLDGATISQDPTRNFVLPHIAHQGSSPFTTVYLFNPSTSVSVEVELSLRSDDGTTVALAMATLPPLGTLSQDAAVLFGVDLSEISGGYIQGEATENVVAFEFFGNEQALSVLNAQIPTQLAVYRIPHLTVGGGFDTELNLINTDPTRTAQMEISVFDDEGMPLVGVPGSVEISLEPGEQALISLGSLLGLSLQQLTVGSLRIDVKEVFLGPFGSIPSLSGSIRFKTEDNRLSASLPLLSTQKTSALYPHVAQALGFYSGVAVLNPKAGSVEETVEVFDSSGVLVGSKSFTLAPGARRAQLLSQLVPASDGQLGGYFRVRASDIVLFSGSHDGANGSADLVDNGSDFGDLGVRVDIDLVRNLTDGSKGVITGINGGTVTVVLGEGSDNDWDTGDQYEILDGSTPGAAVSFALFGDLAGEFLAVIPSQ